MKTRRVETKVVVLVSAVVGLLAFSLFAAAGGLENNGPPSPVGRPFDRIHDAITSQNAEREGYCRTFVVPADSNQVIFTVPDGKRFVLLKLYYTGSWQQMDWNLTVDDSLFINGGIVEFNANIVDVHLVWGFPIAGERDFPSRCAVVYAGETLSASSGSGTAKLTIIGYFYDVQ